MNERQENQSRKKVPDTFTTKDLITEAAKRSPGITKGNVKRICDLVCEILGEQIKEKKSIRLNSVGVMRMRTLAVRKGRNPMTGEPIAIPERYGIKFQMCRKLDFYLNKGIDLYDVGDECDDVNEAVESLEQDEDESDDGDNC